MGDCRHRVPGVVLNRGQALCNVFTRAHGEPGKIFDLVGHHCETFARFARPRRLDGGVECEQIGLLRDRRDGLGDFTDLGRAGPELGHSLAGLPGNFSRLRSDAGGRCGVVRDFLNARAHFLGTCRHHVQTLRHLLGSGRHRSGLAGGLLSRCPHLLTNREQLL